MTLRNEIGTLRATPSPRSMSSLQAPCDRLDCPVLVSPVVFAEVLRITRQGRPKNLLVRDLEEGRKTEVGGHAEDVDEGATSFLRTRRGFGARDRGLGTPEAVSRFQSGDPETVEAVRRLVLDVLRTHSAELKPYWDDLVLEVCAQAWQRVRQEGEGIQNLEGLVARMAHARVIDLHRYRSRWRMEGRAGEHLASAGDPHLGPYENLRREETARLVSALIATVDERTRSIWRLIYFEGLKYREAALRLGLPEGTLKRLVHESLRAASRRFAEAGSIAPGRSERRVNPK